jgi:hypothetical protein
MHLRDIVSRLQSENLSHTLSAFPYLSHPLTSTSVPELSASSFGLRVGVSRSFGDSIGTNKVCAGDKVTEIFKQSSVMFVR